jgi:predicted nuclease with TOPRIM domain
MPLQVADGAEDVLNRLEEAEQKLSDVDERLETLENIRDDDEEEKNVTAADFLELTQRVEGLEQVCYLHFLV